MTTVSEILSELQRRGVAATVEGETLFLKPKRALDAELLERLRIHKPEILDVLSRRPATCAPSCYEVEPGRWIHRPWHACKTLAPELKPRTFKRVCWHCGGAKVCSCLTCWNPQADDRAGACIPCCGTGEVETPVF